LWLNNQVETVWKMINESVDHFLVQEAPYFMNDAGQFLYRLGSQFFNALTITQTISIAVKSGEFRGHPGNTRQRSAKTSDVVSALVMVHHHA
jgi:hypothetical protein